MTQTQTPQTTETATLWGAWSADAPPNILPSATFSYWADGRQWAQNYYGHNWEQFVSLRPVPPEQSREIAARNAASLAYANTFQSMMCPSPAKTSRLATGTMHVIGVVCLAVGAVIAGIAVAHAGLVYCLAWSVGTALAALGVWMGRDYCADENATKGH